MAGIGTGGATGTFTDELLGTVSLTWSQHASPSNSLSYDTSGNGSGTNGLVGLGLVEAHQFGDEGIVCTNASLATNTLSGMVVLKPSTAGKGVFEQFGQIASFEYYELRVDITTHKVELFDAFTAAAIWTSASTITAGEWHVIAWALDNSNTAAVKFNIAIDGTADTNNTDSAGTFSGTHYTTNSTHRWISDGQGNGDYSDCSIAMAVVWTVTLATSDLATRSTASNSVSAGPYAMITAGGASYPIGLVPRHQTPAYKRMLAL